MRDFQKQKVYTWENECIFPKMNQTKSDLNIMENICGYIWSGLGLSNPPKLYVDNDYKKKSTGSRYRIRFASHMLNEFVLVHEMAHSFNQIESEEKYDHHGPNYVADYMTILIKFYGFDMSYLIDTAKKYRVKVNKTQLLTNLLG